MEARATSQALDDEALIGRARAGDTEAFTSLVQAYQHLVHGYALAVTADSHLAQDVAQETFFALHRQLDRLQDPHKLPAYLRMIARRSAVRLVRGRERERVLCEEWPTKSPATGHALGTPRAEDSELHESALQALHRLSPPLREVLVLHYLKGCTHREIAGFLCIPRTRVNNRLHAARQALAQETLKMVRHTTQDHALPQDFAERIGRIIAPQGPVVDVAFQEGLPQEEHDLLVGAERNHRLVAIQRLPGNVVRCFSSKKAGQRQLNGRVTWSKIGDEAPAMGESVAAAPAEPLPGIDDHELAELIEAVSPRAQPPSALLATGIKSLDLLFPLAQGGRVQMLGYFGNIAQVLIYELCRRLQSRKEPNLLYVFEMVQPLALPLLQRRRERPELFFPGYNEGNTDQVQTFLVPRAHAARLSAEPAASLIDAALCFDLYEAAKMRYPNFDVARSRSRLLDDGLVSQEHREVADDVRRTLLEADELTSDGSYLRLVGNDAVHDARRRWEAYLPQRLEELSPSERATVERAERLRVYLATPFFATADAFGVPGKWVDLADTIRDCRAILAGECDDIAVESLKDIGSLEEIR